MEYINIEIEEKFLKCIFFNKELMIKTMHRGSLPKEIFADKSLRFIYQILNYHFIKNGTLANVDILKSNINRLSLKIKLSKNKQDENKDAKLFQEKLYAATDRVFAIEPDSEVYDNFSTYMNELVILMKARSLQEFNMQLFNHLDNAKLDEAEQLVSTFNMPVYGDDVDSSEFTENFAERENEVMKKVDNPDKYKLYSTGIPKLDGILGGGIDREFGVIGGSSNAGKSFLLQHLSLVGYLNKLNIILFTIEMRKIPVQNRLDCAIAGINYNFFRNPALYYNQKTHDKWKRIIELAKTKCGKLEVVSFKKNATMESIEAKTYEIMNRWQKPIHGLFIDYLDDITPKQTYREARNWASFGEISWDMAELSKGFNNFDDTTGLMVMTANQLRKDSKDISTKGGKGQRNLDERDVGSSPLPYRHADLYFGIKTIEPDIMSQLWLMKGRNVRKSWVDCFHNFPYGRFHDTKKEKEYQDNNMSQEERKEMDGVQVENPEDNNV